MNTILDVLELAVRAINRIDRTPRWVLALIGVAAVALLILTDPIPGIGAVRPDVTVPDPVDTLPVAPHAAYWSAIVASIQALAMWATAHPLWATLAIACPVISTTIALVLDHRYHRAPRYRRHRTTQRVVTGRITIR